MELSHTLTTADAASALAWLVDAGLDVPVGDAPQRWLADAPVRDAAPIKPEARAIAAPSPKVEVSVAVADMTGIDSLSALGAAIEGMTHPLRITGAGQQLFLGAENAPLLVLAEMPMAADSDEARLLTAMLASIGVSDGAPASVCILPWPTRGMRPARDADIEIFAPFALRALGLMAPKLILALGGRAAALAEPEAAPATLRGRWLALEGVPMVATFAPAMLLRQPRLKADAWADLQRLAERLAA
jgi:DNA polymerase